MCRYDMASSSQHRCVFVGNIPYDATEEQLIQICEEVGPVVSFRLVLDRETGKPKGYGFCEYKDEETALSARRNLQGYEINGRQLRVDFAENDKGTERNREQGRGGPGLTTKIDAQKPLGGQPVVGDSSLHHPIGFPLASTAASVMATALGESQTSNIPSIQNGLPSQSGPGNDPLTHFLGKMSRHQLYEIMSDMKMLATHNKDLARQLLQTSSQLPKALFQAQIMLGLVTPQMLQMPNIRQSSSSVSQLQFPGGIQDQKPVLPSHHGQMHALPNVTQLGMLSRSLEGQASTLSQNPLISHPSAIPLQQPRFQHPQAAQAPVPVQTALPVKPGVSTGPSMPPQSVGSYSIRPQTSPLLPSKGLISQIQPPLLQQPILTGSANVGHFTQSALLNTHPLSSQPVSNYPAMSGGRETVSTEAVKSASVSHNQTRMPGTNMHPNSITGLAEQMGMARDALELRNRPSKFPKLEDGSSAPQAIIQSAQAQAFGTSLTSASQITSSDGMQHSEKQTPQLTPEVESALLQQVKSLTPEQLSLLPPEQRQQVIQLQKLLG